MNYGLSSHRECFNTACDHDHQNTCTECSVWSVLYTSVCDEVTAFYNKKIDALLTNADALPKEIDSELVELEHKLVYLKQLDDEYHRYVAHIVRKHRSS